jgi:hypothetical protein
MGNRVTQVAPQVVTEPTSALGRVTQVVAQVLVSGAPNFLATQLAVQVIRDNVPDTATYMSEAFRVG